MARIVRPDPFVIIQPPREVTNRLLSEKRRVPRMDLLLPEDIDQEFCRLRMIDSDGNHIETFRWEDLLDGLLELRTLKNGKE